MSTTPQIAGWFERFSYWLHLQWPAGVPEKLPVVDAEGGTAVPGIFIAGDLTGIPLLKFALDSGAKAAQRCLRELKTPTSELDLFDVAIVGAGVSGLAAAVELARSGLRFTVIEANQRLATVMNFPTVPCPLDSDFISESAPLLIPTRLR